MSVPDALPDGLPGLNATIMNQYVEYVADFLLEKLGFSALYHSANPVSFSSRNALQFYLNLPMYEVSVHGRHRDTGQGQLLREASVGLSWLCIGVDSTFQSFAITALLIHIVSVCSDT